VREVADASPYLASQFLGMYDVATDGRFLMLELDPSLRALTS